MIISKLLIFHFLLQTLIYEAVNLIALHLNYCIELFYIDKKFNYSMTDLQYFYSPCEKSKTGSFVSSIMKKLVPGNLD